MMPRNLVGNDGTVFKFWGMQGEKIKRTGFVDVDIANGEPQKVKIGVNAVIAFKTEIEI